MLKFTEIKKVISNCCRSNNQGNIFNFSIDYKKLESELTKNNLHVLAFAEQGNSEPLYLDSIQLVSEYIKHPKEFDAIYNGQSEYLKFMLYVASDNSFFDVDGNPVSNEKMFEYLNSGYSDSAIFSIIKNLPIYRVIVVRKFNPKKEKFDYVIYFRSNNEMITYIKGLKEEGDFFESKDKKRNPLNSKLEVDPVVEHNSEAVERVQCDPETEECEYNDSNDLSVENDKSTEEK